MKPRILLCSLLLSLTITAYIVIAIDSPSQSSSCHPDQRDALLQLKNSFSITEHPPIDLYEACRKTFDPKTTSWREDKDCCSWEGVVCDNSTGDIVGLDLSCARIRGAIDSNSSLFSLRQLRSLSLAGNNLIGSRIPPEISVFSRMTYLNLSLSNISGNVPAEISQLSKLVSLDLSFNGLELQNPTMRMLIKNLTRLEDLDLTLVNMSAVIPISLMNFSSSLIVLHLSECSLGGKFPDYIFQLPNLQQLDLSFNYDLHGTLPESNWSSSLASLSLRVCSFNGGVPNSIGNLTRLTSLDLSDNNFNGHVDFRTFSTLKNLRYLWLSGLSVSGEEQFHWSFPQLQTLEMFNCNLTKFPSFLSQSNKLIFLFLSGNRIEEIPRSICQLTHLQDLELSQNNLTGVIPQCLSNLTDLWYLDMSRNSLTGPIPLPSYAMNYYLVQNNNLTGELSLSLCKASNLQVLDLSNNGLTGTLPQCLKNITKSLIYLNLQVNGFQGSIPDIFHEQCSLKSLDLSRNQFDGSLPRSLSSCQSLEFLDVANNKIVDSFPGWLGDLPLKVLILRFNKFHGRVGISEGTRPFFSIRILDISNNGFDGRLPDNLITETFGQMRMDNGTNTYMGHYSIPYSVTIDLEEVETEMVNFNVQFTFLDLSSNLFSGDISPLLCNSTNLMVLDLSNNGLTGTLPKCLKNITKSLIYLNLRFNGFQGSIPDIFHEQCSLKSLYLSRNQFDGSLPRSLSSCQSLESLDVGNNKILDSFPDWLGDLPLKVLNLRFNKFHGRVSISEGTRPFSSIRILDISNNGFDGSLPENLITEKFGLTRMDNGTHTYMGDSSIPYSVMIDLKGVETEMVKINVQFATFDLSSNHFYGEIPRNIGLLKSLKGLNFSHNSFTGAIPPSLGNLTNLESLDLSLNYLVGGIPRELSQLTSLGALDLSRNNLTGPIPLGGHFNTFSNSSFDGNPGLCGIPLTRSCSQGHVESQPPQNGGDNGEDETGGWLEWKYVAMGFGSGLGIGISLGYMALETGRPLWLARMVIRLETSCRKGSKRKSPRRNGRR